MPDVRFFTRDGCGLCQEALALVEVEMARLLGPPRLRYQPCTCGPTSVALRVEYRDGSLLQVVDVDLEPDLKHTLGFEVPVIDVDGQRASTLKFDRASFAATLRAKPGAVAR